MKCLLRYEWVKLLRACLPEARGYWGIGPNWHPEQHFVKDRHVTVDIRTMSIRGCGLEEL